MAAKCASLALRRTEQQLPRPPGQGRRGPRRADEEASGEREENDHGRFGLDEAPKLVVEGRALGGVTTGKGRGPRGQGGGLGVVEAGEVDVRGHLAGGRW